MKRKILSLALALALITALLPMTVSAANDDPVAVMVTGGNGVTHILDANGNIWRTIGRMPSEVVAGAKFKYVSANLHYTLAIDVDGNIWSWGDPGRYGNLGDGTTEARYEPKQITNGIKYTKVAVGPSSLAIDEDGNLWGWGGQSEVLTPRKSYTDLKFTDISEMSVTLIWYSWMNALDNNGKVWEINYGFYPVKQDLSFWAGLYSKMDSKIISTSKWNVIDEHGNLWGWVYDDETHHYVFEILMNGTKFTSVFHASGDLMAIDIDGNLWVWNETNETLDTEFVTRLKGPVKILEGTKFSSVALTSAYWYIDEDTWYIGSAIDVDGGLWAFEGHVGEKIDWSTLTYTRLWKGNALNSASDWAREGITAAIDKGFVPDEIQGSYKNVITRQEFCRMAVKWVEYATGKNIDAVLTEQGKTRDTNAFTDTSDPDILAAFALGITNGTGNNKFTPNGQFSREQAATMIRNTCKVIGMDTGNVPTSDFADLNTASTWAIDGINFVRANGIMQGVGGDKFSPGATYTREQSIITFNNIKVK